MARKARRRTTDNRRKCLSAEGVLILVREGFGRIPDDRPPDARQQHFSRVSDFRLQEQNVCRIMRGGRARWKIENETFNTLKNQGDQFEHNFGHGQQNLSVLFAVLMMLAFLADQTQQLCCPLFRRVWKKLGSKKMLWERMRAFFREDIVYSMREIFEALSYGYQRP